MRHIKVDTLSMTRAKSISILCAVLGVDSLVLAGWPSVRDGLKEVSLLYSPVDDWRLVVYVVPVVVSLLGLVLAMRRPRSAILVSINTAVCLFWAAAFIMIEILSSYTID